MVGLVASLYEGRLDRPDAWNLLKDRLDELFPREFEYTCGESPSEVLPLFGDLIEAAMRVVDAGDDAPLRGLGIGTTNQRHIVAATPIGSHRSTKPVRSKLSPGLSSGASTRSLAAFFTRRSSSRSQLPDLPTMRTSRTADSIWACSPPRSPSALSPRRISPSVSLAPTLPDP